MAECSLTMHSESVVSMKDMLVTGIEMYFRESFLPPTKRYAYCDSSNVTDTIILQRLILLEGLAMLESVIIG